MRKQPNEVALGIDRNYLIAALHIIYAGEQSKEANVRISWNIFFFKGELSPNDIKACESWFRDSGFDAKFTTVASDPLFGSRRWLTSATFLKLRASEKISGPFLWLDADTFPLAGWTKVFDSVPKQEEIGAVTQDETGMAANQLSSTYFNAGVMRWNSSARREWKHILQGLPDRRHSSDQVLFNLMYKKHWEMDKRFNAIWGRLITDKEPFPRPYVIHYGGAYKPWHLHPEFRQFCVQDSCVWSPFLQSFERFERALKPWSALVELAAESRRLGRLHLKKDGLGQVLGRLLDLTHPISYPGVMLLRSVRKLFPKQALHPIHSERGVWKW